MIFMKEWHGCFDKWINIISNVDAGYLGHFPNGLHEINANTRIMPNYLRERNALVLGNVG